MLETLSVMSFPKDIDSRTGDLLHRVRKPLLGSRWLETGALGLILGTHEASPFEQSSRIAHLPLIRIRRILAHLTSAAADSGPTVSQSELKAIKKLTRWMNSAATRFEKRVPEVPAHEAIWLSEYDGGDGVTLPGDTQKHFEDMQREHLVAPDAKESGLVKPESTSWLRTAIDKHDGVLLTINEGNPQRPLTRSEPEALLVMTFCL
jgi:hypothetical protein